MTCVVALRTDAGEIYMGGDSFCGSESYKDLCVEPKVFMVGEVGVGICGHVRQELILRQTLHDEISAKKDITEHWIKHDLSEAVREAIQEKGAGKEKDGMHSLFESAYLLCHAGVIYYFDDDYGIWMSRRSYAAIGCGRLHAMGSLHTSVKYNRHNEWPEYAVNDALEAAADHDPFVAAPMLVMKVEPVDAE